MTTKDPYYGARDCSAIVASTGNQCTNKAYYKQNGRFVCGVHSNKETRTTLKKDPNIKIQKANKIEKDKEEVELAMKENVKCGLKGDITCVRMKMMKEVENIPGYLKIFPNFKHGGRQDGIGCSELSPMSLGPVIHNQDNLPICHNIENYHQGNKRFSFETDEMFESKQLEMYNDEVAHRHKYDRSTLTKYGSNVNIPLYSVINGKKYSYIESRYFYCYYYELLAKETESYNELRKLIDDGYNLAIYGYDGYEPGNDIYQNYVDASRPFGHELVLYCLLTIDDPKNYPWNVYHRKYIDIYG